MRREFRKFNLIKILISDTTQFSYKMGKLITVPSFHTKNKMGHGALNFPDLRHICIFFLDAAKAEMHCSFFRQLKLTAIEFRK